MSFTMSGETALPDSIETPLYDLTQALMDAAKAQNKDIFVMVEARKEGCASWKIGEVVDNG